MTENKSNSADEECDSAASEHNAGIRNLNYHRIEAHPALPKGYSNLGGLQLINPECKLD